MKKNITMSLAALALLLTGLFVSACSSDGGLVLLSSQRDLRELATMYYRDLSDYRIALAELESLVGSDPQTFGVSKFNAMRGMQ
jgi:hypothetical protein